jgi:hypothetical protein
MTLDLPENLEAAIELHANSLGVSPSGYICELLKRDLAASLAPQVAALPLKSGFGMLAKYGQAPSAEEIDANRADMFRGFGADSE